MNYMKSERVKHNNEKLRGKRAEKNDESIREKEESERKRGKSNNL
jgi:hypothetical protein